MEHVKKLFVTIFITVWLLLLASVGFSADLSRGFNFTDGSRVFASQLHTLVDSASILTGFYTDKTLSTLLDSDDIFLVYSGDNNAFRKISANSVILANTNLITLQVEDTSPATNDYFLSFDTSAGALKKVSLYTVSNNITAPILTLITSTTNGLLGTITNTATNSATLGWFYNLMATNQVGDVSNRVGVVADEVLLKNSAGSPFIAASVAVTIDVTSTGANGREAGSSDSANQWFYTWIIYNGSTVAGFLSTNIVPTLPTGYTHKALVGAVRNNSAADFLRFVQRDKAVAITNSVLFTGLTSASGTVLQTVSGTAGKSAELSALIPPIAKGVKGSVGSSNTSLGHGVRLASDSTFVGGLSLGCPAITPAINGFAGSSMFELTLSTPQDFYWLCRATDEIRITIGGFSL